MKNDILYYMKEGDIVSKRKVTPLAVCEHCSKQVPPMASIVKSQAVSQHGVVFLFKCPFCMEMGRVFVSAAEAQRRNYEMKMMRVDEQRRREIGRLVKGFAIDLEAVETVEDLELYWSHQERVDYGSVPREGDIYFE